MPSVFRGLTLSSVIVWLAVALWVVIVVWSLALMRVASTNDRDRRRRPERQPSLARVVPVFHRHRERIRCPALRLRPTDKEQALDQGTVLGVLRRRG